MMAALILMFFGPVVVTVLRYRRPALLGWHRAAVLSFFLYLFGSCLFWQAKYWNVLSLRERSIETYELTRNLPQGALNINTQAFSDSLLADIKASEKEVLLSRAYRLTMIPRSVMFFFVYYPLLLSLSWLIRFFTKSKNADSSIESSDQDLRRIQPSFFARFCMVAVCLLGILGLIEALEITQIIQDRVSESDIRDLGYILLLFPLSPVIYYLLKGVPRDEDRSFAIEVFIPTVFWCLIAPLNAVLHILILRYYVQG